MTGRAGHPLPLDPAVETAKHPSQLQSSEQRDDEEAPIRSRSNAVWLSSERKLVMEDSISWAPKQDFSRLLLQRLEYQGASCSVDPHGVMATKDHNIIDKREEVSDARCPACKMSQRC
jgi:hypothetical protein